MSPDDPRHGTRAGYNAHQKQSETACDACKRAAATYQARREWEKLQGRPRSIPAIGVQRRIQALMAIGWSSAEQAKVLGRHKRVIERLRFVTFVHRETYDQIVAMYEQLSGRPGPSTISRTRARAAGYAPPLAWDDIDDPDEQPTGHDICGAPGCAREIAYRGLCMPHYRAEGKAS